MFAFLEPYMLWIKIALAALALALAFGSGWTTRGWKCDADQKDALAAQLAQHQAEVADYKAELAEQEKFKDDQRRKYQSEKAVDAVRLNTLEEEIRNAPLNTVTPREEGTSVSPDEPFNREFVRLWNRAVDLGNGVADQPADGPDVPRADTSAAVLTREDVLDAFRKVAGLYRDCKVKQAYAIEYDRQQGEDR